MKPYCTEQIQHTYPHCWRSGLPLMYRAVSCWFVDVDKIRGDILKVIKSIKWIPDNVGTGRMYRWVADGKQNWCFSRNRYWGAPIPIWTNGNETVIISNTSEFVQHGAILDGDLLNIEQCDKLDLHRPTLDKILIPSKNDSIPLKRIPEVFDCWFESGSMPFASGQPKFKADFISEGVDQTRGWFYTLLVISTALKQDTAFRNVIVNGIVLAKDGQKMSKSKGNYEPIMKVLDQYGADATRLYLAQTKATKAEAVKIEYSHIRQMVQKFHIPLQNVIKLLDEAKLYKENIDNIIDDPSINACIEWIESKVENTYYMYNTYMNKYELWNIVELLKDLIDDFSRKFINMNKHYLIGEKFNNLVFATCKKIIYRISLMLAPFAPHLAEWLYLNNYNNIPILSSIHDKLFPDQEITEDKSMEQNLNNMEMNKLFVCLEEIKRFREEVRNLNNIGLGMGFKYPIKSVKILKSCCPSKMIPYIKTTCNVMNVELLEEKEAMKVLNVNHKFILNYKEVGKRLGKRLKYYKDILNNPTVKQKEQLINDTMDELTKDIDYLVTSIITVKNGVKDVRLTSDNIPLWIDSNGSDEQYDIYHKREFKSVVSKLRKNNGLKRTEQIIVYTNSKEFEKYGTVYKETNTDEKNFLVCMGYNVWI